MSILVLSGPVGAGKSTVARELLAGVADGVAYIEGDAFWAFLSKPAAKQPPHARFAMTMRAMFAAAWHYHRDDYEVLLDFSVPPGYLPAARRLLRDAPFHYALLLPPASVCAERAASRQAGTVSAYERYREFYDEFESDRPFVIRDQLDVAAMADHIRDGVRTGRFLIA